MRNILIITVVILQISFFAIWAGIESGKFSTPIATIKVKTLPVDPRDLLSGQYMRIGYEFSRIQRWENSENITPNWAQELEKSNQHRRKSWPVWIVMRDNGEGIYEPIRAYKKEPTNLATGEVFIRGYHKRWNQLTFGIERYYVPEGTPEPRRDELIMELNIHKQGKVRIKQAYVNNAPWPAKK